MITLKEITKGRRSFTGGDEHCWTHNLVGRFVRINTAHYAATEGWVREADGPFLLIEPYSEAYGSEARVLVQLPVASIYFGEQPKRLPPILHDTVISTGLAVGSGGISNSPNSDIVTNTTTGGSLPDLRARTPRAAFGGKKFNPVDPVHEGREI